MPSSPAQGTAVFALITQQLKDVGITAQVTDSGTQFIADVLAPKYPAAFLRLQQDPTDWQIVNFAMTPTATWNPFDYADPKVADLIGKIQVAKTDAEATPSLKELNAYVVDQAWFAPWFRIVSHYAVDADTQVKPQAGNIYPYLWNFTPKS
jgi:peptide/nickel transport system substrate-binding protein